MFIYYTQKVDPEETEDGEDVKIVIIWNADRTAGLTAAACTVQPIEKPADGLVIMPRLAFSEVSCNCAGFPRVGDIVISLPKDAVDGDTGAISQQLQRLDLDSESDVDENEEEERDDEKKDTSYDEELFTEFRIQLKGSIIMNLFNRT